MSFEPKKQVADFENTDEKILAFKVLARNTEPCKSKQQDNEARMALFLGLRSI